jgi:hypothetical protein
MVWDWSIGQLTIWRSDAEGKVVGEPSGFGGGEGGGEVARWPRTECFEGNW